MAFINSFWQKIKCNSQYSLEDVLDLTAQLKDLQAILKEFDLIIALSEKFPICYFKNSLQVLIEA